MRVRYVSHIVIALLGLALGSAAAQAKEPPKGDADFRAGWVAYATPAASAGESRSLEARQEARMAAIPLMEAAVAADPRNWMYQESLGYVLLAAGQYDKAKTAIDKAISLKRDRPLLYMLRGQAEAALVQMDPPKAAQQISPAITDFDRAAGMDRYNALPVLQAASVAFDTNRSDYALERVKRALQRPGSMLYTLSVPTDLMQKPSESVQAWQYIQLNHWNELLSRFRNVHRSLLSRGRKFEERGDLGTADEHYRWALQVARQVGEMQPHLVLTVATAVDMMQDAYVALGQVAAKSLIRSQFAAQGAPEPTDYRAAAKELIMNGFARAGSTPDQQQAAYKDWGVLNPAPLSLEDQAWDLRLLASFYSWQLTRAKEPRPKEATDLERWNGEAGVMSLGRSQLAGVIDFYLKETAKDPKMTVPGVLSLEARIVEPVIAGIGLNPKVGEIPEGKAAPAAQGNPGRPK